MGKIYIFKNEHTLQFQSGSSYLNFEGINVRFRYCCIEFLGGSHHINFKDCDVLGGQYIIMIRTAAHDILLDNICFQEKLLP